MFTLAHSMVWGGGYADVLDYWYKHYSLMPDPSTWLPPFQGNAQHVHRVYLYEQLYISNLFMLCTVTVSCLPRLNVNILNFICENMISYVKLLYVHCVYSLPTLLV